MIINLIMGGEILTFLEQSETSTINENEKIDLGERIISLTKYIDVFDKKLLKKINRIFKREGIISEELEECSLYEPPTGNEIVFPKRVIELKRKINPSLQKGYFQVKTDQNISDPNEYKNIMEKMDNEADDSEKHLCLSNSDNLVLVFMAEKKGTCVGRFNLI